MKIELEQTKRTSSFGLWKKQEDGSYRCGNVKVAIGPREDNKQWDSWRIFVLDENEQWEMLVLKNRPWGYGHAGQAKIGAALAARHQREK